MSDRIELPTDEDLQHWDHLATQHVTDQALPIGHTEQGMAVAELVRAVPRLLHLIAMERTQADLTLEAMTLRAGRAEARLRHAMETGSTLEQHVATLPVSVEGAQQ